MPSHPRTPSRRSPRAFRVEKLQRDSTPYPSGNTCREFTKPPSAPMCPTHTAGFSTSRHITRNPRDCAVGRSHSVGRTYRASVLVKHRHSRVWRGCTRRGDEQQGRAAPGGLGCAPHFASLGGCRTRSRSHRYVQTFVQHPHGHVVCGVRGEGGRAARLLVRRSRRGGPAVLTRWQRCARRWARRTEWGGFVCSVTRSVGASPPHFSEPHRAGRVSKLQGLRRTGEQVGYVEHTYCVSGDVIPVHGSAFSSLSPNTRRRVGLSGSVHPSGCLLLPSPRCRHVGPGV